MGVKIEVKGNWSNTQRFLMKLKSGQLYSTLSSLADEGVKALASATPIDTGRTSQSWTYDIHSSRSGLEIVWSNANVVDGRPIAVLLQYGHGTRNGGYVQGRDYINPAMRPVFDSIADRAWKAVIS